MSEEFLKNMKIVPAGRRSIVKLGDRYAVYLPMNLNEIWEYLHSKRRRVNVYLIVDNEAK